MSDSPVGILLSLPDAIITKVNGPNPRIRCGGWLERRLRMGMPGKVFFTAAIASVIADERFDPERLDWLYVPITSKSRANLHAGFIPSLFGLPRLPIYSRI